MPKALFELASGSTISTDKGSKISPNCTNRTTVRTRFPLTSEGPLTAAIARMLLLLVYLDGSTNVPPEVQLVLPVPSSIYCQNRRFFIAQPQKRLINCANVKAISTNYLM